MALRTVAVLVPEQTAPFEFGLVHEVFGIDRTDDGVPPFELRLCGTRPGAPMPFGPPGSGMQLSVPHGLDAAEGADLVVVPAYGSTGGQLDGDWCVRPVPDGPQIVAAVRAAHDAGSTVLSVCSGAFALGEAGLLDGRRCTTHWRHTEELARRHPAAVVDPDVLFVHDGRVLTSAGTAAGIDACLHLVRDELGADVANRIARRMVVPPQRDGGQRQFIEAPVPECSGDSLQPVLEHVLEALAEPHPVSELAARAALSERTFARRFVAETGTTPARWLAQQRIARARVLLEESDLSVEQIASRTGFSSASLLRHHFTREVGVAPLTYRRRFARTG